ERAPPPQCQKTARNLINKELRRSPAGSGAEMLLHLVPGQFRGGACPGASLPRMAARGGAFQHTLHDALADAGDAEEVVRHTEFPHLPVDRPTPGPRTVGGDVLPLARNSEREKIEPLESTGLARRGPPEHHVVGEVGERMPERRELPVDDREHA